MSTELSLISFTQHVAGGAVAIRRVQRLQPAGGIGDKVFPPTYEGGQYATEDRVIDGQRVPCVLLDSVQSQANRMELALKAACYNGKEVEADIPVVTVDFDAVGLSEVGEITSLDAPHRLADAIFRDSRHENMAYPETKEAKQWHVSTAGDATGLFEWCPTGLVFGMWFNPTGGPGNKGSLGTRFQRIIVSEIVGINHEKGKLTSSQLNTKANIQKMKSGMFYNKETMEWSLEKKEGFVPCDPSDVNHGAITPSINEMKGGSTLDYAQQSVVISLPALRRLRFPVHGKADGARDAAAQTALAALAIAAADLSISQGCDLRSRCLLIPDATYPASWEIIDKDGKALAVSVKDAHAILVEAAAAAAKAGLPAWKRKPLILKPSEGLAALVKKSRELAITAPAGD